MREKELVCIGCPLGCSLKVTIQDDSTMEVTGMSERSGLCQKRTDRSKTDRHIFGSGGGRPSAMCICEDRIRYTKRQDI